MKYFYSQHDYEQYRPKQSWRQRLFSRYKSRAVKNIKSSPYHSRTALRNPYRKELGHFTGFKYIIIILLLLFWVGLLIYLPNFRITKITFNGLNIIKINEINGIVEKQIFARRWPIPSNNYFLINSEKIINLIENNFTVSDVKIEKKFPNNLIINIEEKISSVIYDNSQNYYLLDQTGDIVKNLKNVGANEFISSTQLVTITTTTLAANTLRTTASTTLQTHLPDYQTIKKEFGDLPLIYDGRNSTNTEGHWLSTNLINSVIEFYTQIKKQNLIIKYFYLDSPLGGVRAYINGPWDVYFTPDPNTITTQLNNLKTFIQNNKPIEYIDLRYGERIYWK